MPHEVCRLTNRAVHRDSSGTELLMGKEEDVARKEGKPFTIEVERKKEDEEFNIHKNLRMLHRECSGGAVVFRVNPFIGHYLSCQSCGTSVLTSQDHETTRMRIEMTAIDGQQRRVEAPPPTAYNDLPDRSESLVWEITVVQSAD